MGALSPNAIFMNGKSHSDKKQGAGSAGGSSSKGPLILGLLGVTGLVVAIAVFNSGPPARTNTTNATAQNTEAHPSVTPGLETDSHKESILGAAHVDLAPDPTAGSPKKVVFDIVTVASLTNEVTAADAKKFKDGLTDLVRQGAKAVPAIQDYLDKNLDSNYGNVKGAEELGYSSVRHAFLDTLKQIGGPEAEGAMVHVLQTTAEPNEVGELARNLEAQAPGQYRDQILQAAREALDMAHDGRLGKDIERGPLYRVFQSLGAAYAPPPDATPATGNEHETAPANPPANEPATSPQASAK